MDLARQEAETLGVSVSVYLRMLFRQSLSQRGNGDAARKAAALRFMSDAMSQEASVQDFSEDDILRLSKAARKRLAAERRTTDPPA